MEISKYKKFLKDDNYVHCTICANFSNSNSFAHRKSEAHQSKLKIKLRKVTFYLKQTLKKPIVLHDEHWNGKDVERFCHFCGCSYGVSYKEEEFIVENLGIIKHHASSQHYESVKSFLKRNFSLEDYTKYCILEKDLNSFLSKLPEQKRRYLKKMDILNDMVLKQIKETEEERKKVVDDELQALETSCSYEANTSIPISDKKDVIKPFPVLKNKDLVKLPPWLEDIPTDSSIENQPSVPVIGPTMDTLIKHVENQKKKGLSKNRIGANFVHKAQSSSGWLPSFQGVWNQGCRKQQKHKFNRRHKNSSE